MRARARVADFFLVVFLLVLAFLTGGQVLRNAHPVAGVPHPHDRPVAAAGESRR
jgi:hypothetical protein